MIGNEIREIKIVDLVARYPQYARLGKAINQAAKEKTLPFETVGEILDNWDEALASFLQIKSIGGRTMRQFCHIIDELLGDAPREISNRPRKRWPITYHRISKNRRKPTGVTREGETTLDMKIVDLVNAEGTPSISFRLWGCINQAAEKGELPLETVKDYLAAGNNAWEQFLKIRNLGNKTAIELDMTIRRSIGHHPKHAETTREKDVEEKSYRQRRNPSS